MLYHTDKEGNVTYLLDGSGNAVEHYTFDAFGAATITDMQGNPRVVSAYGNDYMFNGKEYVAEMNLYYYCHRWYQPQLGRFLQVDPKGFDGGDENLFRYCMDDPVDKTDPDGMFGTPPEQSIEGGVVNIDFASGLHSGTSGSSLVTSAGLEAQWASSHGSSGSNSGYTVAWQGTVKQARAAGLVPITQDKKLQSRSPREAAIEAAMQAKIDSKGDTFYSYNVYRLKGKVYYQRSDAGVSTGLQTTETMVVPPAGAVFVANGHVHAAINRDDPHRNTAHSDYDRDLSNGRTRGIVGTGPVIFINKGSYSFHEYNQGVVTTIDVEGYGP